MGRELRFALIGAGGIGQFHAETLARHLPDAQLAAVVDTVIEKARAAVATHEGAVAYADAEAALERDDIDAVVIATPTRDHAGTRSPSPRARASISFARSRSRSRSTTRVPPSRLRRPAA